MFRNSEDAGSLFSSGDTFKVRQQASLPSSFSSSSRSSTPETERSTSSTRITQTPPPTTSSPTTRVIPTQTSSISSSSEPSDTAITSPTQTLVSASTITTLTSTSLQPSFSLTPIPTTSTTSSLHDSTGNAMRSTSMPTAQTQSTTSVNVGRIAGPVAGAVAFIILATIIIIVLRRRRKEDSMKPTTISFPHTSESDMDSTVQQTEKQELQVGHQDHDVSPQRVEGDSQQAQFRYHRDSGRTLEPLRPVRGGLDVIEMPPRYDDITR
ncbi:hypothetical protein VNI00_015109 [Paramarasmius palmivorus]|uniref:Uncharacterized protein n=1 Tax=Paramarasmius palmivorus TaxID=297713 RepID=A0AAW0BMW5_9AGAR